MNRMTTSIISQVIVLFVLLLFPLAEIYAKSGCCSKHGGVAGCDSASGHQLCKDGTASPSCACNGTSSKPTKAVKKVQTNQQMPVNNTTIPTTMTPTTTTTTPATNKTKTKGCCSRHGGVGQCNKGTGYFMCKDGTQSITCKCA